MTDLENTYVCNKCESEDGENCRFDTTIDDFSIPEFCPFTGERCEWTKAVE